MNQGKIVNRLDKARLMPIVADAGHPPGPVCALKETLASARAVAPPRVPGDVVTMNSVVCVRYCQGGGVERWTLAYPQESAGADRVSVLAPIGAALLGRRVGDKVRWAGARGMRVAVVEGIDFQPERAGRFDL